MPPDLGGLDDRTEPRIALVASAWPTMILETVRVLCLTVGTVVLALKGKVPAEWALVALGAPAIPGLLGMARRVRARQ